MQHEDFVFSKHKKIVSDIVIQRRKYGTRNVATKCHYTKRNIYCKMAEVRHEKAMKEKEKTNLTFYADERYELKMAAFCVVFSKVKYFY